MEVALERWCCFDPNSHTWLPLHQALQAHMYLPRPSDRHRLYWKETLMKGAAIGEKESASDRDDAESLRPPGKKKRKKNQFRLETQDSRRSQYIFLPDILPSSANCQIPRPACQRQSRRQPRKQANWKNDPFHSAALKFDWEKCLTTTDDAYRDLGVSLSNFFVNSNAYIF